jgi:hypothetical protein
MKKNMNTDKMRNPSSFLSGFTSLNASYVITVLANHAAIELFKLRDTEFIKDFIGKLGWESKKVDEGRERWYGHDFVDDRPMIEANVLTGWPFVINLALTTAAIDLLEKLEPVSVKHLTDKIVSSITYLERKFPPFQAFSAPALVEVVAPIVAEVPSVETPTKPKRIRMPATKKTATKAKTKAKPFNLELIGDGNTAPDA